MGEEEGEGEEEKEEGWHLPATCACGDEGFEHVEVCEVHLANDHRWRVNSSRDKSSCENGVLDMSS